MLLGLSRVLVMSYIQDTFDKFTMNEHFGGINFSEFCNKVCIYEISYHHQTKQDAMVKFG